MNPIFAPSLLRGKKILVTGASSGIGKATALTLASYGAELVISGRNEERLSATAVEARPSLCSVEPMAFNDFEATSTWAINLAKRHGPFDGMFHAAGEAVLKPMRLVKQKDFNQVFNPSLIAATALCTALSKKDSMRDGGTIVLMSSVAGSSGRQGMGLYSASKAGIDGLTRSLAIELASRGIRVNSLAAGAVRTELHAQITESSAAATISEYEAMHPLGFGELADVANLVVYLMSDAGRWITGAALTVDGGFTAR